MSRLLASKIEAKGSKAALSVVWSWLMAKQSPARRPAPAQARPTRQPRVRFATCPKDSH